MYDFIVYAVLAGVSMVCSMCPTGCIILWRRVPYFGDAIAHAAILGVVMGLILDTDITLSVIVVSVLFSLTLFYLKKEKIEGILVVVFSYGFFALGLFMMVFSRQTNIASYLFGDILLVSHTEVKLIALSSFAILIWLYFRWKQLLLMSINEDLAMTEGVNVRRIELEFLIIVALLVSISIKIVGALLVASMLTIPGAAARNFSESPAGMLYGSVIVGVISVLMGLAVSYFIDSASGPSIVLSSVVLFLFSLLLKLNRA